jgi:hypothetical protein
VRWRSGDYDGMMIHDFMARESSSHTSCQAISVHRKANESRMTGAYFLSRIDHHAT